MSAQGKTTGRAARRRSIRPWLSVQHRLVLWVMVVAAIPVLVSVVIQSRLTRDLHEDRSARSVTLVGSTIAAALSGRVADGWSPEADRVIDAVTADGRVALVIVTDPDKQEVHRRAVQPEPYRVLLEAGKDEQAFALDVGKTHTLGEFGQLAVRTYPVWSAPRADGERVLQGYVMTAVYDDAPAQQAVWLEVVHVVIALGSLLVVLPVVSVAAWRMVKPLHRILAATRELAETGRAEPVPAHRRDEIGLLGEAFNDMATELASAHESLRQHNENLEGLITERTVELEAANQKLAEQMADKDAFLRSVSHDLNAPLRNIDGMASMVLRKHRDTLNDDVIRKLERICANVKQETELINELVELNRLRDNKKQARGKLVDLNKLVEEVFAGLAHQCEEADIQLIHGGTLPTIKADATRIRQVFQNLIDNAAKYMMDSHVRRIAVQSEEDLDYYYFSVQDTGRGIAWEDQPKVFQVFQRSTHSGTHQVQGKGVGLASVKSIVESYGGQIWVESELGKGSTFHFTLSREKVSPPLGTLVGER